MSKISAFTCVVVAGATVFATPAISARFNLTIDNQIVENDSGENFALTGSATAIIPTQGELVESAFESGVPSLFGSILDASATASIDGTSVVYDGPSQIFSGRDVSGNIVGSGFSFNSSQGGIDRDVIIGFDASDFDTFWSAETGDEFSLVAASAFGFASDVDGLIEGDGFVAAPPFVVTVETEQGFEPMDEPVDVPAVPLPASAPLMLAALSGVGLLARRRRR